MNNTSFAFLLTLIAGASTMIGAFIVFVKSNNKNKIIAASLSFASAVMIGISVCDISFEAFNLLSNSYHGLFLCFICFLFIFLGIIFSSLIGYYFPHEINNKLYRVGLLSVIAIVMHNIPEGIATFIATSSDVNLGISLTFAIAMHNIPEGIAISIPIYYATKRKFLAFKYTLISALSEPFGALITYLFLKDFITSKILGFLFLLIMGIMLQIAFCELLKSAKSYKEDRVVKVFFIFGLLFVICYVTLF